MEVFELVRKGETLPDVIQALVPISFIGQKAVTFYREKIKLMNQLGVAEEQKKITLADGQDAGRMLLDIEAKIGELLPPVEDIRRAIGNGQKGIPVDSTERGTIEYPKELNLHKRHMARAIANHPEAVAEVIKEAEKNEDIPTKTAVLTKIKLNKLQEQQDKPQALPSVNQVVAKINGKLEECYTKLRGVMEFHDQLSDINRDTLSYLATQIYEIVRGKIDE